ncbi:MAG: helix-turn-helix domain-containing protein [Bacilli bacterium]|nr:MAG: helix-turn-helix domain-containing protein [Bacilli bacterium]
MLKVNRNYLSRVETGKSEPTAGTLKDIAEIFGIDLNSLLDISGKDARCTDRIKIYY